VDHRRSSPPWTDLRRQPEELTRVRPTGAPVHESSPRLHGKDVELARVQSGASPEVEERRGGRATAVVLSESDAQAWREEKRGGEGRGETRGWSGLLGVQMPVSNGQQFTAEAIDGRGGC
jgi:hypothetical protein